MVVDLHTHTTASDGLLSPADLVAAAAAAGVELLAITDHDTTAAHDSLAAGADLASCGMRLIPGIEWSTVWGSTGIHVLGLNIDLASDALRAGVAMQRSARQERAERIAEKLSRRGFDTPLAAVQAIAGDAAIGRPHFARYLVAIGAVRDENEAFDKYLGTGKDGDIKQQWAPLSQIIDWTRDAGGTAVLAHPAKYKITNTKLRLLLDDFRAAGGEGMEVISGQQTPELTRHLFSVCEQKKLLASCGSDFHRPGQPWAALGKVPALPSSSSCKPVWAAWS